MPFKVVIDACVVYPATVRDVLLSAAYEGLYQRDEILDEASRNLIADGRITEDAAARTSAAMRRAFPESTVTDFEDLIPVMRNDPKDRHVVAAAVKAGAQVIVTANLPDFQNLPSGIEAQTPDTFLCNLFDLAPDLLVAALRHIVERHKNPPTTLLMLTAVIGPELTSLVADYLKSE